MSNIDFSLLDKLTARIDKGGKPPDDGGMEARISKLEGLAEKTIDRLTSLERDVAVILSNYATKEDLHKELNSQTWKFISSVAGLGALLVSATYFIVKHVP
jgi:hypothetical protein